MVPAFTGLEPLDFRLWRYLKDRVYGYNPQTIHDLKAAITAAIRAILREEGGSVTHRELFPPVLSVPAVLECLFRVHFEAPVKQRAFVVQT